MEERYGNIKLDGRRFIKDLKVVELKAELEQRGLSKYGNKKELVQRLSIFEESRQKSLSGQPNPSAPNQWLENEADLNNDFLREYFKSQKALFQEHIERRNQIEAPPSVPPRQEPTAPSASTLKKKKPELASSNEKQISYACTVSDVSPPTRPSRKSAQASRALSIVSFEDEECDDTADDPYTFGAKPPKKGYRKRLPSTSTATGLSHLDPSRTRGPRLPSHKVPSLKIKIPESETKVASGVTNPSKFRTGLSVGESAIFSRQTLISEKSQVCLSPQNAEVSSSVQEESSSIRMKQKVRDDAEADSTSSEGSAGNDDDNKSASLTAENYQEVSSLQVTRKERTATAPVLTTTKAPLQVSQMKRGRPRLEIGINKLKPLPLSGKLTSAPVVPLSGKLTSAPVVPLTGKLISAPVVPCYKIPDKNAKTDKNASGAFKKEGDARLKTSKELFASSGPKTDSVRRSGRITKSSFAATRKKNEFTVRPLKAAAPSAGTKPPVPTILSEAPDFFESLKQQIEMPLHIEKFPSSDKSEVSSTSELLETVRPLHKEQFPGAAPIVERQHVPPSGSLKSVEVGTSAHPSASLKAVEVGTSAHPSASLKAIEVGTSAHPSASLKAVEVGASAHPSASLKAVEVGASAHPSASLKAVEVGASAHPSASLKTVEVGAFAHPSASLKAVEVGASALMTHFMEAQRTLPKRGGYMIENLIETIGTHPLISGNKKEAIPPSVPDSQVDKDPKESIIKDTIPELPGLEMAKPVSLALPEVADSSGAERALGVTKVDPIKEPLSVTDILMEAAAAAHIEMGDVVEESKNASSQEGPQSNHPSKASPHLPPKGEPCVVEERESKPKMYSNVVMDKEDKVGVISVKEDRSSLIVSPKSEKSLSQSLASQGESSLTKVPDSKSPRPSDDVQVINEKMAAGKNTALVPTPTKVTDSTPLSITISDNPEEKAYVDKFPRVVEMDERPVSIENAAVSSLESEVPLKQGGPLQTKSFSDFSVLNNRKVEVEKPAIAGSSESPFTSEVERERLIPSSVVDLSAIPLPPTEAEMARKRKMEKAAENQAANKESSYSPRRTRRSDKGLVKSEEGTLEVPLKPLENNGTDNFQNLHSIKEDDETDVTGNSAHEVLPDLKPPTICTKAESTDTLSKSGKGASSSKRSRRSRSSSSEERSRKMSRSSSSRYHSKRSRPHSRSPHRSSLPRSGSPHRSSLPRSGSPHRSSLPRSGSPHRSSFKKEQDVRTSAPTPPEKKKMPHQEGEKKEEACDSPAKKSLGDLEERLIKKDEFLSPKSGGEYAIEEKEMIDGVKKEIEEENQREPEESFKSARKVSLQRSKSGGGDDEAVEKGKKRKWGSSKPSLEISSVSLKCIIPNVKPLSPSELELKFDSSQSSEQEEEEEEPVQRKVVMESLEEEGGKGVENGDEETARGDELREKPERKKRSVEEQDKRKQSRSERIIRELSPPKKKGLHMRRRVVESGPMTSSGKPAIAPARNPVSKVVLIQNLVRPFTIKQLRDLLQRTGRIVENGFWIDSIKSKCLAMFETEDEADETRVALHGVKWPTINPKNLHVDFSTEEELAKKLEETSPQRLQQPPDEFKRDQRKVVGPVREWDLEKLGERSPGEREREKERLRREREEERIRERRLKEELPKEERKAKKAAPVKSVDDLFRKTKAQPSIYWLPLTAEQITEKEALRRKRMAETERMLAEMKVEQERQRQEREAARQKRREREREREKERNRSRSPRRAKRSQSRSSRKSRPKSKSRSRSRS